MKIFITGTDTNIGKTLISSWLCLKSGYEYFKPIQAGDVDGTDSDFVRRIAKVKTYQESYRYKMPVSPHLAAKIEDREIMVDKIKLPAANNLIIEGAGGALVPINREFLVADLIKELGLPVIIVSYARLGTINHTLLTIEALRSRGIEILGFIMNGSHDLNQSNIEAIEFYGRVKLLSSFPTLNEVTTKSLSSVDLSLELQNLLSK